METLIIDYLKLYGQQIVINSVDDSSFLKQKKFLTEVFGIENKAINTTLNRIESGLVSFDYSLYLSFSSKLSTNCLGLFQKEEGTLSLKVTRCAYNKEFSQLKSTMTLESLI